MFSVTHKEKYFIKKDNNQGTVYATYAYSNYLPTFGGGHDIYLAENCNQNSSSYANFNYSYDSKGRGRDDLTGAYNFQVKELEMYHVEYTGSLLTESKKSKWVSEELSEIELMNIWYFYEFRLVYDRSF